VTQLSNSIAARVEDSYADLIRVVSGLTPAQLAIPCDDHGGDTVGDVAAHLADGARQVLAWVAGGSPASTDQASADGASADGASADGAGHDHPHVDPAEITALLQRSADTAAGLLRGLTDEQLQAVLPAAPGIADGNTPLEQVIGNMLDHQAHHLAHMEQALARQSVGSAAGLPQDT
jgi:hypothetical protein